MSYELPDDVEKRIQARLDNGRYQTKDDLLRDALDALDQLEQAKLQRWHKGNRIALEQSRLGLSKPLDEDELVAEIEAELAQEGITE